MKPSHYYTLFEMHAFAAAMKDANDNPIPVTPDSPTHFMPSFTSLKKARKWTPKSKWHLIQKMEANYAP